MNFEIAKEVMTPPAFSNKPALAVWAISAFTVTLIASTVLTDFGKWVDRQLNDEFRYSSLSASTSGTSYMNKIKYGAAQISKGVAYCFSKAVYLSLAVMCLDAAKSNDVARITALGVLALGYFSGRNNLLSIFSCISSVSIYSPGR